MHAIGWMKGVLVLKSLSQVQCFVSSVGQGTVMEAINIFLGFVVVVYGFVMLEKRREEMVRTSFMLEDMRQTVNTKLAEQEATCRRQLEEIEATCRRQMDEMSNGFVPPEHVSEN